MKEVTRPDVVEEFGRLTGIKFRHGIVPYDVGIQSIEFAKHFEIWELCLVVEWTKAKIRAGEEKRNGFSELSLQWHRLIAKEGDDKLTQFQQRLGLAMIWARKFRPSLLPREELTAEEPAPAKPNEADEVRNVDPSKVSEAETKTDGRRCVSELAKIERGGELTVEIAEDNLRRLHAEVSAALEAAQIPIETIRELAGPNPGPLPAQLKNMLNMGQDI